MSRWTLAWFMATPVFVGTIDFVLGGIGPAVFGFVGAAISVAFAARFYRRWRIQHGEPVQDEAPGQFRRLWLVVVAVGAIGVVTTFISMGPGTGLTATALWAAVVASGAVVLVVTRHPGRRAPRD